MSLTLGMYDLIELYPDEYNKRLLNKIGVKSEDGPLLLTIGVIKQEVLARYPDGTVDKLHLDDVKDNIGMEDPRYWNEDTPAKQKQRDLDEKYANMYEYYRPKSIRNPLQHRVVQPRQYTTSSGYQCNSNYDTIEVDRHVLDDLMCQLNNASSAIRDAKKLIQKLD